MNASLVIRMMWKLLLGLTSEGRDDAVFDAVSSYIEDFGDFSDICRALYYKKFSGIVNGYRLKIYEFSENEWCIAVKIHCPSTGDNATFLVGDDEGMWVRIKGWGSCPVSELESQYRDFVSVPLKRGELKIQRRFIETFNIIGRDEL